MIASTISPVVRPRIFPLFFALVQNLLMAAGLIFIIGLIGQQIGLTGLVDNIKTAVPVAEASAAEAVAETPAEEPSDEPSDALSPRMRGALDYVSRRYRVSTDALQPIFATAQLAARDLHLDPLLIIAVIGVESGFNPFSQSVVGAQGLMQVMPRFHKDKLPEEADQAAFLDPITNVQIGAKVLKESIRRFGGLEDGLQQFGGASNDPDRRYSSKVLAEKQRLEVAAQRLRST